MHTRSSSTILTRRRSPLRISFDHHYYLLAALTVSDGSGAAVRRARGQVAIDETNAGNALQWDVQVSRQSLKSGSRGAVGQGSDEQHADPDPAQHETPPTWEGLLLGRPSPGRPIVLWNSTRPPTLQVEVQITR